MSDPTAQPGDGSQDMSQDTSQGDPSQGQPDASQHLDALKQGFDSVLASISQGQPPDPQMAKSLCEFLEQFSGEEQQGSEEQGEAPQYE